MMKSSYSGITLFSGNPGQGKSLHLCMEIYQRLKNNRNVIANFPIVESVFYKKRLFSSKIVKIKKMGKFEYIPNANLTVRKLVQYAMENHKPREEAQTLLCIDECQLFFNPREYMKSDRLSWNNFFIQHRKLGYKIILVAVNGRILDRQIRDIIEFDIKHRQVSNFGGIGKLFPRGLFACITYWCANKKKLSMDFIRYSNFYGEMYDTYKMFDTSSIIIIA